VPTEPCSRHLHGLQELIHDTAQNDTFMSRRGGGAHVVGEHTWWGVSGLHSCSGNPDSNILWG
jgi:hypothetical protein